MADVLSFVPPRVPIANADGTITRPWFLYLQGVFNRIGGPSAETNTEIVMSGFADAGIEETKAVLFALTQNSLQNPVSSQPLVVQIDPHARLEQLEATVAELVKEIQSLKQSTLM